MQVKRLAPGPFLDEQVSLCDDPTLVAPADAPPLVPMFPDTTENPDMVLYQTRQGGFEVRWHVDTVALTQTRKAFGNGPDRPSSVLRLQQIDPQGARQIITDTLLEGQDVASVGFARCPAVSTTGLIQAELGLSNQSGGWLLIARSNGLQAISPVGPAFLGELDHTLVASAAPLAREFPMPAHIEPSHPLPPRPARIDHPSGELAVSTAASNGGDSDGEIGPQETVAGFGDQQANVPDADIIDQSGDGALALAVAPETRVEAVPAAISIKVPIPGSGPVHDFRIGAEGWIGAELLVHGNASPGALLDLGGHSYQVGAGGRFSFRVPLTDRELIMRLLAMLPELPVQPRGSTQESSEP